MVFDVVADQRNEPSHNLAMTETIKVTPGPIGVGTRFSWDLTVTMTGRPRGAAGRAGSQ